MLIVLDAVHGAVSAMSFPAMASMVPQLVPRSPAAARQRAAVAHPQRPDGASAPRSARCWSSTVGPGWALAVDALTWLLAALLLLPVRSRRRPAGRGDVAPSRSCARAGPSSAPPPGCGSVVLGFGVLNAIHTAPLHPRPGRRQGHHRRQGWGYVLSAEAVGLLRHDGRAAARAGSSGRCFWGMLAIIACRAADAHAGRRARPRRARRARPSSPAPGIEVFGMGWNLAMQENIDERDALARLLLRHARLLRRDADRQLAWGPLGRGVRQLAGAGRLAASRTPPSACSCSARVGARPAAAYGGACRVERLATPATRVSP